MRGPRDTLADKKATDLSRYLSELKLKGENYRMLKKKVFFVKKIGASVKISINILNNSITEYSWGLSGPKGLSIVFLKV